MQMRVSRRACLHLCASLAGGAVGSAAARGAAAAPAPDPSTDKQARLRDAEAWIDGAVARAPEWRLYVEKFKDPMWFLTKPVTWTPDPAQSVQFASVEVPSGFVSDFASIPKIFWSILPRNGEYLYAALIHDFLYWTQMRPKATADDIFRLAMQDFGISIIVINVIYEAVQLVGQAAWDDNARLKSQGERRILKRYPENQLVTWEEWKRRDDVFAPE
jgi:hypothetical protein